MAIKRQNQQITIVGAGYMNGGIAQVFAMADLEIPSGAGRANTLGEQPCTV